MALGVELCTNPGFYPLLTPWVIEGFEWAHSFDVVEYTDYGVDDTFYQTISITENSSYSITVNGVATANMAKVNSVAKANIKEINQT